MYTQCPECLTAFRVTPALLQQASGRVRCGSCGHGFSAVEHLSEDPPTGADPALQGGSDRQDDAIETFTDSSAFDDVRLEDTGVEWRIVDDEPQEEASLQESERENTSSVRWYPVEDEGDGDPGGQPGDDAPLPELDDLAAGDPDVAADDGGGIQVEESGIRSHQEPLDLPRADPAEPRYDDNTQLPDDFYEKPPTDAEPPRRRASDHVEPRSPEFDERQVDLRLGDPEDWRDLLDEFGNGNGNDDIAAMEVEDESTADTLPSDIDTQFDLQAVELGIDLSGTRPALRLEADAGDASVVPAGNAEAHEPAAGDDRAAATTEVKHAADSPPRDEPPAAGAAPDLADGWVPDDPQKYKDQQQREDQAREVALEAELTAAYAPDNEPVDRAARDAQEIPPQTEEEMTINMQIDQDLLRAMNEEGFTSTMTGERKVPEDSLLVETIVMEGDFVQSALDKELEAVVQTVGDSDDDPRLLLDTYIKSKEPIRRDRRKTDPASRTVVVTVAILGIVLAAQVVHAYRDSLATYGAFNLTVGPVYRLFGAPLVPDWNVRGWRFESTNGSTDESNEVLTIRSRIANESGKGLPYPLLHVALTDRFEEIIGSRVLQPAEYLAEDVDSAVAVPSGSAFAATITVEGLSGDATGFKLNICYRQDRERLRCATEDFRD